MHLDFRDNTAIWVADNSLERSVLMLPAARQVMCRQLRNSGLHTFPGMVGYCTKFAQEPHYRVVVHNITYDFMEATPPMLSTTALLAFLTVFAWCCHSVYHFLGAGATWFCYFLATPRSVQYRQRLWGLTDSCTNMLSCDACAILGVPVVKSPAYRRRDANCLCAWAPWP